MMRIPVHTASRNYEAVIEHGLLTRAGTMLKNLLSGTPSLFVISVSPVRRRWGRDLLRSLEGAGFAAKVIEMPDGERFKRLSTVELLSEKLLRIGADRKAVVVAFGGGVVGDVGGMLASVYMRGVKLIQIPTTVQAQLDAAIGGKTGVNLRAGKNLVGTFYQPEIVLIDPALLATLPEREFRAGMYEALKCGVIGNADLFSRLEAALVKRLRGDSELLSYSIAESVRLKAQVVSADEREGDLRRVLNFGHTLGHAIEAASGYRRFLHGEAVAWGMIAAAHIALEMGLCSKLVSDRIRSAILSWGKLPPLNIRLENALALIQADKKTEAGIVHFVLPREIGKVEIVKNAPNSAIAAALAELRRITRG